MMLAIRDAGGFERWLSRGDARALLAIPRNASSRSRASALSFRAPTRAWALDVLLSAARRG
jgi:hypothetical protein